MSLVVTIGGVTIANRFNVQWSDIMSDVGNGEFTLLRDDAQAGDIDPGDIAIITLDGTDVFAFVVEEIEDTILDPEGEAAEITRYSGRSTAILLDKLRVYPSKGVFDVTAPPELAGLTVVAKPTSPDRYMGWMEPSFDDTGWASATVALALGGDFRPKGQPDLAASWIWFEAPVSNEHPVGDVCLFRRTFTTGTSSPFAVKIIYAALDDVEVYLDGVLVNKTDPARETDVGQWAREAVVEINGSLPHTLAFKVQHLRTGMAGLTYTVFEHNTDTVLARSGTSTRVYDATAGEPGLTPGAVMNQLLTEGADRGWAHDDFASSFNATDCSRPDEEWPTITGAFEMRVGDSALDVLNQLAEGWVEWTVEPGQSTYVGKLLAMWNAKDVDAPGGPAPGRGSASGVTFEEGVNCTRFHRRRRAAEFTHVLVEWGDGQLDGGTVAETTHGRLETFLSLSNVRNGPSAIRTAAATVTPLSDVTESVVVEIQPEDAADTPYLAFGIGDTVSVSTGALTSDYRVVAISCQEDEEGYLTWLPELATATEIYQQKQQRWLRRTSNGTLDGVSKSATPSSEHIMSSGKVPVHEETFSTAGADPVLAADIGTNWRIKDGSYLIYRMDAEANVAGVSGSTTIRLDVDAASTGETVSLTSGNADGTHDISPPILVGPGQYVNIYATAAGGHEGVNVTVFAVPTE